MSVLVYLHCYFSNKSEQPGRSTPSPRQRPVLPKDKLRQTRQQRQTEQTVEIPNVDERRETEPPVQRDEDGLEHPGPEHAHLENEAYYHRQKPVERRYYYADENSYSIPGQNGWSQHPRQRPIARSHGDIYMGNARYDPNAPWVNSSRHFDLSGISRANPTERPSNNRRVLLSTKMNSQSTSLKRTADERYSRMKPTEKPKDYVLVRKSFDVNRTASVNSNNNITSKTIARDTEIYNSESMHSNSKNVTGKAPVVNELEEKSGPHSELDSQKAESNKAGDISVVNASVERKTPLNSETSDDKHVSNNSQNSEELNSWMK